MKFPLTARLARMCALACALALVPTLARAFPEPDGEFFVDLTGSVRGRDKLEIARTLRAASESSGVHAMLLVINRVADHPEMPQEITPFANKVAEEWRVGEQRTHKGVITVFALQDRKFAVATTKQLDAGTGLDERIKAAMGGRVTENLRSAAVGVAMRVAASNIAEALPAASSTGSGSSSVGTAEPRRTTTTTTTRRRYQPTFHSGGGSGFLGSILGLIVMVFFFTMILRAFAPSGGGGYGGGFGGGYGGGFGGGGGGFWSGMFTGGLLGWMFGGHGGWGGYNYHGYGGQGGGWSDDTTTTTTTTESWSSGSESSTPNDSSSSSSFDSFGGGDWGGGGSSGEW